MEKMFGTVLSFHISIRILLMSVKTQNRSICQAKKPNEKYKKKSDLSLAAGL